MGTLVTFFAWSAVVAGLVAKRPIPTRGTVTGRAVTTRGTITE
jgi:hypothetical protein